MGAPGTLNLTIYAGKDFSLAMTWGEQDTVTGVITPWNAIGRTLRIKVRRSALSAQVVATFTSAAETLDGIANGTITLLGAVSNNITLTMSDTETAKLQQYAGVYKYDCDWIAADGTVEVFTAGTVTIVSEYTY